MNAGEEQEQINFQLNLIRRRFRITTVIQERITTFNQDSTVLIKIA